MKTEMRWKRWIVGLALLMPASVLGFVEASASRFQLIVLADDLTNQVHGSAPESNGSTHDGSFWSGGQESGPEGALDATGGGGGSGSAVGFDARSDTGNGNGDGGSVKSSSGPGNDADRVDASNPGTSKNDLGAQSCSSPDNRVDDETSGAGPESRR